MNTSNTTVRPESPLLDFGPFGRRPKGWEGKGEASYFTISELTASATALREGIDNRPTESAYHLLHVLVEQLLDPIREAWGKPIVVSSGYRCKELNALVGGAKNSHHMLGCAADITAPLCSQAKLLDADKSTAVATDAHTASAPQPKVDAQRCQSQGGKIGSAMSEYLPLGGGREGANRKLFNLIQQMQQEGKIRFTQLILEGDGRWIHISYLPLSVKEI